MFVSRISGSGTITVLIVDDDPAVLNVVNSAIEREMPFKV
jgi:hypothetical protein